MKKTLISSLLAVTASISFAQTNNASNVHFFVGADAGGGGDTLATVTYTDGSSQDIKAGNGIQIKGGVGYRINASTEVIASIGWQFVTTHANNGSVGFDRFPLEVLGLWNATDSIRLGGGLRYASGAKFSSSGVASNLGSASLDSKLGYVLMGEYLFEGKKVGVSLRAVNETFSYQGTNFNGNHVGMGLNYYF